jgi:hypothetical protein
MAQVKRDDSSTPRHRCPVCDHPQIKLRRRLGESSHGSTIYVCPRAGECSVGVNLTKIETWVAV